MRIHGAGLAVGALVGSFRTRARGDQRRWSWERMSVSPDRCASGVGQRIIELAVAISPTQSTSTTARPGVMAARRHPAALAAVATLLLAAALADPDYKIGQWIDGRAT